MSYQGTPTLPLSPSLDVYHALATLLLAFVQQDQSFLQDVAQGDAVA